MFQPEIIIVPIAFIAVTSVITQIATFRHREKMAKLAQPQAGLDSGMNERMERLEQAVETIAIEIERIGEGQRFVTKRLAERTPIRLDDSQQRARAITPH